MLSALLYKCILQTLNTIVLGNIEVSCQKLIFKKHNLRENLIKNLIADFDHFQILNSHHDQRIKID